MTGLTRIADAFRDAPCFMPYMMGGFPTLDVSAQIAEVYVSSGARLIELGVPFSDPLADGEVIQAAGSRALDNGTTLDDVLGIAKTITTVPVIVMCYANLIVHRGADRFVDALVAAGVCGLIVPDLPFEESAELAEALLSSELAFVQLVAPTTPPDRIADIAKRAQGFIYAVSVTGTTGERAGVNEDLASFVSKIRFHSDLPMAVGFGVSSAENARAVVGVGAHGVIVGSRLVRAASESVAAVELACEELSQAISPRR